MPTISPERGQPPGYRPSGGHGSGSGTGHGRGPSHRAGQPGRARLPQPDAPPGGRARERLRAVGAVLALLTIVGGVPAALILLVGSPIPVGLSSRGALTNELDSAAVIAILSGVVWLAWAHFVVCVVAEARSELRGNGLKPRFRPLRKQHRPRRPRGRQRHQQHRPGTPTPTATATAGVRSAMPAGGRRKPPGSRRPVALPGR
nr:hypothetical protein [Micromonospora sp. DSM 115978]